MPCICYLFFVCLDRGPPYSPGRPETQFCFLTSTGTKGICHLLCAHKPRVCVHAGERIVFRRGCLLPVCGDQALQSGQTGLAASIFPCWAVSWFIFETGSLIGQNLFVQLDWLAREPQVFCLCLLSAGITSPWHCLRARGDQALAPDCLEVTGSCGPPDVGARSWAQVLRAADLMDEWTHGWTHGRTLGLSAHHLFFFFFFMEISWLLSL